MSELAPEHLVAEAIGPPLTPLEVTGAIGVGVNGLLIVGLFPSLMGALADEHRLTASGIGLAVTVELLAMALTTGFAGVALKPARLKLIGVLASLGLAVFDAATMRASGVGVLAMRGGAGVCEGLMLWITVGMIARTVTPERWAAVYITIQTVAQLLLSVAYGAFVIGRFGANGGFACLAICSLASLPLAMLTPSRYAPLVADHEAAGFPPLRGWIALLATLAFVSATGAVSIYLEPFALQAGLSPGVARTAVSASLAAQVVGGGAATAMAGRVRYFHVFVVGTALTFAAWVCFTLHIPALVFIAANALAGIVGLFVGPFFVPMTIEADPSRRAAVQTGPAQILGGALGPLMASVLVSDRDSHPVILLGGALLLAGLAVIAWLHFTSRHEPVRSSYS
ncbi:MAG: MFS transporter [Caulobacterales bacterium]